MREGLRKALLHLMEESYTFGRVQPMLDKADEATREKPAAAGARAQSGRRLLRAGRLSDLVEPRLERGGR